MNINNIIFKTYLTKCDAKPFYDVFEGFFFILFVWMEETVGLRAFIITSEEYFEYII